jgi:hypothetical protein
MYPALMITVLLLFLFLTGFTVFQRSYAFLIRKLLGTQVGSSPDQSRFLFRYEKKLLRLFSWSAFQRSISQVLLGSFQVFVNGTLFYLDCRTIAGHDLLIMQPDISCSTTDYKLGFVLFGPMMGVVCLSVVCLPFAIWHYVHRREEVPSWLVVAIEPYRKGRTSYWECWVLVRRLAMSSCFLIFLNEPFLNLRRITLGILHVVSLAWHQLVQPYESQMMNLLEGFCLACLVAISFLTGTDDIQVRNSEASDVVILIVCSAAGASVMIKLWVALLRVSREKTDRRESMSRRQRERESDDSMDKTAEYEMAAVTSTFSEPLLAQS